MRENRKSGSMSGRWKRLTPRHLSTLPAIVWSAGLPKHHRTAVESRPSTFDCLAVMFRRKHAVQFNRFNMLSVF